MPREYELIRAAKLLNTQPWILDGASPLEPVPLHWISWAFVCEKADNLVQKHFTDGGEDD